MARASFRAGTCWKRLGLRDFGSGLVLNEFRPLLSEWWGAWLGSGAPPNKGLPLASNEN